MSNERKELYEFDKFRLEVSERILWREDTRIPLSEKAFDTLYALLRHGNHLVGKEELLNEVWADTIVEENNLDKNISLLRQVLGERNGKGKFIETVRGHGYRFVPVITKPDCVKFSSQSIESDLVPSEPPNFSKSKPKRHLLRIVGGIVLIGIVAAAVFYTVRYSKTGSFGSTIRTIAVLPFKSLATGERNETLELGMTDTLINNLSSDGDLIVRPISSVRRFNDLEQDAAEAGRILGVDSVLDGTIQTANERIRVTAKLIRTSDGKQLWSGQFDEKFTDIFAVQDSISQRVVEALTLKVSAEEQKRLTKRPTENIEAYQLYQTGRFHTFKLTGAELQKGISYLQQAIALDPNYALAYVGLADAYRSLALSAETRPAEVFPQAKAAAIRAIEIDDGLAEAHSSLGNIILRYEWNVEAAEAQYKRALELDQNSADTHVNYAHLLSATGHHTEAISEIKRARELDPLNLRTRAVEAQTLNLAGQPDLALERLQKTFELDPNFWLAHQFAASAYIDKENYGDAISEAQKAGQFSEISNPKAFLAFALARSGRPAEARSILEELLKTSSVRYVSAFSIALIYNGLGERDKALSWLELAFNERDARMVLLKVEPKWKDLRDEPRFQELVRRIGSHQQLTN